MLLIKSANNLLDQLDEVVLQLADEEFQKPIPLLNNASIGQHVRHTLEFFVCLIDARNDQKLNYDKRKHDRYIERETQLAHSVIQSIKNFLDKKFDDGLTLTLEANYTIDGDNTIQIPTTFRRELAYNIEHAIHHMALIKIGVMAVLPNIKLAGHFGVASSTVRFRQNKD